MGNFLLATSVLSDAASLTTSTAPATLPAANLQTRAIQEVFRASDASAAYIVADLGEAKDFNLVALLGHTGSSRSYARVRAAASEAALTAAPVYDSGNAPFRSHQSGYDAGWASGVSDEEYGALATNHFLDFIPAGLSLQWVRIDFVDPNQTYVDVGRLYIANAFQPSTNMNYGESLGFIDPSRTPRTAGGRLSPTERPKYRVQELTISFNSEDEMFDGVFDMENACGTTKDVLFVYDPDQLTHLQKRTIYGSLKSLQPIVHSNFGIFEKPFRIEEIT